MTILSDRFRDALAYADEAHVGQFRRGTEIPYVSHVLAVAALALEFGATEDEAIAALLHDAVEDSGGAARLADIRSRFGDVVATIVSECSDTDITPKPPWEARKRAYITAIATKSESTLLVSACDKLHNGRSIVSDLNRIGTAVWSKFNGGRDGTQWYYRELLVAFQSRLVAHPSPRVDRVVDELAPVVKQLTDGSCP